VSDLSLFFSLSLFLKSDEVDKLSCTLIFLSKIPTPKAKKNTKSKILYGVFPIPVKTGISITNNIMPPIKTKIEFAVEIPFLDARNKPTTSGNKNTTIKPSYLNCVKMLAVAAIILEKSNGDSSPNVGTRFGIISMDIATKATATSAKYDDIVKIFFLFGKSDNTITAIVSGKSPTVSGCESAAATKEIVDNAKLLKIKYIESR